MKTNKKVFLWTLIIFFQLYACSSKASESDRKYLSMINTPPIAQANESTREKHPPEKIAKEFVAQLQNTNLAENIKRCAAMQELARLGSKSKCSDAIEEEGESQEECAMKAKYWKGKLRYPLISYEIDLNGDNVPDYIMSGDSCSGLSYAYTFDYFILLSQSKITYKISFETNANYISIVRTEPNSKLVIIEGINSYNGDSANIWMLDGNSYKEKACFYKERRRHEFSKTSCSN